MGGTGLGGISGQGSSLCKGTWSHSEAVCCKWEHRVGWDQEPPGQWRMCISEEVSCNTLHGGGSAGDHEAQETAAGMKSAGLPWGPGPQPLSSDADIRDRSESSLVFFPTSTPVFFPLSTPVFKALNSTFALASSSKLLCNLFLLSADSSSNMLPSTVQSPGCGT